MSGVADSRVPAELWFVLSVEEFHLTMDKNSIENPGEVVSFDGLQLRLLATIRIPVGRVNTAGVPLMRNFWPSFWTLLQCETSCAGGAPLLMRLYMTSEDVGGELEN
jgi:hypothetical protein